MKAIKCNEFIGRVLDQDLLVKDPQKGLKVWIGQIDIPINTDSEVSWYRISRRVAERCYYETNQDGDMICMRRDIYRVSWKTVRKHLL